MDWTNDRPSLEHAPSRWSYRSVSGEDELKSTTFLTCPRQTASGWAYIGAVGSVVRQSDLVEGQNFLPARRISLRDPAPLRARGVPVDELMERSLLEA